MKYLLALSLITAFTACVPRDQPSPALGQELEKQMWQAMKNKDWASVQNMIATEFQSSHADGARTRDQEIALIQNLNLGNYTLGNFQITTGDNSMVVTYTVAASETIDKALAPKSPIQHLSVWQKTSAGWQWIAHANFDPASVANTKN